MVPPAADEDEAPDAGPGAEPHADAGASPSADAPKTIAQSRFRTSRLMMPSDANTQGNVYGGAIIRYVDEVAAVVATRHARKNVVTASIDRMDFYEPVYIGDLLVLKAALNRAFSTSMEVGVRVEAEHLQSGDRVHTGSAYLTFVALDDRGRPAPVPKVEPTNEQETGWHAAAKRRREQRLAEAKQGRDG